MGWSEAHTNPEDDPALLRAELSACRSHCLELRAELRATAAALADAEERLRKADAA